MIKRILVPLDGSEFARNATRHACDLAKRSDAEVVGVAEAAEATLRCCRSRICSSLSDSGTPPSSSRSLSSVASETIVPPAALSDIGDSCANTADVPEATKPMIVAITIDARCRIGILRSCEAKRPWWIVCRIISRWCWFNGNLRVTLE